MQDLIDIALEGGCLAVEDLDRMPVRLVACPDRADRCSAYCRSKPSVRHQPAVKSLCTSWGFSDGSHAGLDPLSVQSSQRCKDMATAAPGFPFSSRSSYSAQQVSHLQHAG